MDRKHILFLAVVGSIVALSAGAIPQRATTPPNRAPLTRIATGPRLLLRISAKKHTIQRGEDPGITVSIENPGRSTVKLLHPGDASDYGWRTPTVGWSVINADDPKAQHPKTPPLNQSARCGNVGDDVLTFALSPGGHQKIADIPGTMDCLLSKLWEVGRYRVVFYYFNDPKQKYSDFPRQPRASDVLVRRSTKCALRSNELLLTIEGVSAAMPQ